MQACARPHLSAPLPPGSSVERTPHTRRSAPSLRPTAQLLKLGCMLAAGWGAWHHIVIAMCVGYVEAAAVARRPVCAERTLIL